MTKQIIPFSFTDSDGDRFNISNIRIEDWDGGPAVFFTVNMNGNPTETLEWLDAFVEDGPLDASNLWINHRGTFGEEAYDFIWDTLVSWLSENRQVAA